MCISGIINKKAILSPSLTWLRCRFITVNPRLRRRVEINLGGIKQMAQITMKELLEAGVHFGHRTHRWNPKMKKYIYAGRNGIYIIDLHQTLKLYDKAKDFIQEVAQKGEHILFVGTKKQAQDAIEIAAKSCKMYWVNQRWLGGMLTNYKTIQGRIRRLEELGKMEAEGVFEHLTKKEASLRREEMAKLERFLGGIKDMPGLPGAIFIIDLKKEKNAVAEARKLEIPIVAVVDTNCDPDEVDYVIPANDDAIRAIKLICTKLAESINEVTVPISEGEEMEEIAEEEEKPNVDTPETVKVAAEEVNVEEVSETN